MAYRQDLFAFTLNQLRSGRAQEELSERLNELISACQKTGKVGDISLKIKVRPDRGDTGQYFLKDSIDVKLPQLEKGETLMWGTPEGNLQRTDPKQGDLDLRSVDNESITPRSILDLKEDVKKVN